MTVYDDALAVACPVCKAPAGQECDAPRKRARPVPTGDTHKLHVARQDRGVRAARKNVV